VTSDSSVVAESVTRPTVFGELFHRHAAGIRRYVVRRAGESIADDVVSETFLIAFQKRASYDLEHPDARPWLYGIATNLIHRRRVAEARVLRTLERTPLDPHSVDLSTEVDARIDATRKLREVARSLRRLSSGDRDCILLYAWADMSYEQVGVALGIPVGTVRSRISRARRSLRLATEEVEEDGYGRAHIATDPA
jgi:RNA polymerase sigma factor (sigma-70 family)